MKQQGFIALILVLVLSAIFLEVVIGVSLRAISKTEINMTAYNHDRAQMLSEACAEYALIELRRTIQYVGNESILIDGQSCEIFTLSVQGGLNRIITTESVVSGTVHRTRVTVSSFGSNIEDVYWESVKSF